MFCQLFLQLEQCLASFKVASLSIPINRNCACLKIWLYWSLACLYSTFSLKIGMLCTKYMIVAHKWLLAVVDSTAWMPHADPISAHRSINLDWISITVIDMFCAQVACMIPSRLS